MHIQPPNLVAMFAVICFLGGCSFHPFYFECTLPVFSPISLSWYPIPVKQKGDPFYSIKFATRCDCIWSSLTFNHCLIGLKQGKQLLFVFSGCSVTILTPRIQPGFLYCQDHPALNSLNLLGFNTPLINISVLLQSLIAGECLQLPFKSGLWCILL